MSQLLGIAEPGGPCPSVLFNIRPEEYRTGQITIFRSFLSFEVVV
jgi:hypothetical protein